MVLAVPAPPARLAGSRLSAGVYGPDVTDSVTFLANPPDFVGTQTVVQSIPNNTWTPITLDTEQIDTYSGHSTVSNTSRFTCPFASGGWVTACGVAVTSASGTGARGVRLQVNGSPVQGVGSFGVPPAANDCAISTPTRDIFLSFGDYLEVAVWQSTGGALNSSVDADLASALWVRFSHA